ncbi:MAG: helix-turn-helix transcriptional regulator [Chloroflexota bacterium]|nr:helix-turn-helix transcriptional regulator [Chloroflexota bacterium]
MTERPNRIRQFRLLADISQQELGRRVGVTKQSISDWERGKCWPSFRRATALADALGCSLDGLFVPPGSGSLPDRAGPAGTLVAAPGAGVTAVAEPVAERPQPARVSRSRAS